MIKKWILVFFVSFLFGCSVSSQSQSTDSIINPADRQIWIPADENELERRRVLQARFNQIEKDIDWFKGKQPSSENILIWAWNEIAPRMEQGILHRLRLVETHSIYTDYYGPEK